VSLNFNLTGIVRYNEVCYDHLTFEEVEATGKSVAQLMVQGWHRQRQSPLEQLASGICLWRFSPITHRIVHSSMTAQMNRIENAAAASDFFNRCYIAFRTLNDRSKIGFSREDVNNHIGLTTNVRHCTRDEWLADLYITLSYRKL